MVGLEGPRLPSAWCATLYEIGADQPGIEALAASLERALAGLRSGDEAWWDRVVRGAGPAVNVIPDGRPSGCLPTLVANACLARSHRHFCDHHIHGRHSENVFQEVRRHLITCAGTTRIVLIITESWGPECEAWEDNLPDFVAHQERGVVFVVGLRIGRSLQPITIHLPPILPYE